MSQFIPFPNVQIINVDNSNIKIDVLHYRHETLEEGCKRVAEQYRYQNSNSKTRFTIEQYGKVQLDSNGKKILV